MPLDRTPPPRSPLGPLPRRVNWHAGGALASLALVLAGITAPQVAVAAQRADTSTLLSTTTHAGSKDKCRQPWTTDLTRTEARAIAKSQ